MSPCTGDKELISSHSAQFVLTLPLMWSTLPSSTSFPLSGVTTQAPISVWLSVVSGHVLS